MEKVRQVVAVMVGADKDAFTKDGLPDFMGAAKAVALWALENTRDERQGAALALAAALANYAWADDPEGMEKRLNERVDPLREGEGANAEER